MFLKIVYNTTKIRYFFILTKSVLKFIYLFIFLLYLCRNRHLKYYKMNTVESLVASRLLGVQAVKLQPNQPFTWASGWKSPIYCDNRKTLSYPEVRSLIKLELARIILEKYPDVEAIAGVATGAIAQGALVADLLNKPFVYVRSKPKDHGLENLIEGELRQLIYDFIVALDV